MSLLQMRNLSLILLILAEIAVGIGYRDLVKADTEIIGLSGQIVKIALAEAYGRSRRSGIGSYGICGEHLGFLKSFL